MAQKRKLEEYHDPDYPQNNIKIPKLSRENNEKDTNKQQKISDIVSNEFEKEINNKEQEIYEINHRIFLVRKMLHKVCFAVISNYYNKRNLNLAPDEVVKAQESISRLFNDDKKGLQNAIHPSLKKILGSNDVNYRELLNSRPTRQAAKTAQSTIKEKFKTKKELRIERLRTKALESIQENATVDESSNTTTIVRENLESLNVNQCNIAKENPVSLQKPLDKVQKLNTDRGVNLSKQIIAVGNTSKFIHKDDLHDKITHKWLIYVQSKTHVPIEKFVKKVRFYLHPSYKPNVVDVESPPFQLTRRGWGEFPVRIQLYFYSKFQQKPVQFYHNLVLDKTLTGLQTMGSETLVEVWLRSVLFSPEKLELSENISDNFQNYTSYINENNLKIKEENFSSDTKKNSSISPLIEYKDNIIDFLNDIDPSISTDPDNIEPTLILSPSTHTKLKISEAISSPNTQIQGMHHMYPSFHPNIKRENSVNTPDKENLVFENGNRNKIIDFGDIPLNIKQINDKLKETINDGVNMLPIKKEIVQSNMQDQTLGIEVKHKVEENDNFANQKSHVIVRDGKVTIIDPHQNKLKKRKQISLLKPVIKQNTSNFNSINLQKDKNSSLVDHDYTSPWKDEIVSNHQPTENRIVEANKCSAFDNIKEQLEDSSLSGDFISVVISDDTKQLINLKKKITLTVKDKPYSNEKPFIDYRGQFELKLHSTTFASEENLIEYCLKNVPLIDDKANDEHYKMAFPFVIENATTFRTLLLPKRKALEWLQCKYFSTLMKNHDQFPETSWSTKEIILYARSYGFTLPQNVCAVSSTQSKVFKNIISNDEESDEIQSSSESLEQIYKWINEYSKNLENSRNAEKINIDDESDTQNNELQTKKHLSPIKYEQHSMITPIEENFEKDSKLIKEICRGINIDFKPELISQDIHFHAAELMIIKIFRKFLENLIRKSLFEGQNLSETQCIPVIEVEHVKNALLLNPEYKFLTSKMHKSIGEIKNETT
ncbi:uncharacterized protein LOC129610028 [Condylostylus longicornis]|uniref:uncharacterized protein LOC129610028 n=1 Tax=Condylostylus longicornis TaxID=2530218 RepID=UPI00244DB8A9|nr:uncharacterized protein LOC129610028 [Condylostylus longicornis]